MGASNGALAAEMRERRPVNPSGASLFELGGYGEEDSDESGGEQLPDYFPDQRSAALTLLTSNARLTRQAGSFLGQLAVDPTPLSQKQSAWLATLLDRAGLPPLGEGALP